jgi:hypothetical protein
MDPSCSRSNLHTSNGLVIARRQAQPRLLLLPMHRATHLLLRSHRRLEGLPGSHVRHSCQSGDRLTIRASVWKSSTSTWTNYSHRLRCASVRCGRDISNQRPPQSKGLPRIHRNMGWLYNYWRNLLHRLGTDCDYPTRANGTGVRSLGAVHREPNDSRD